MKDQCYSATEKANIGDFVSEGELLELFSDHPWLKSLEPYYIEWELVWLM